MKKVFQKLILAGTVTFLIAPVFVLAQVSDYTVLQPLPGIDKGKPTTIETYLPQAFNISIAVAAVLAFVMITFGGMVYATSDSVTTKHDGRQYIENAIYGLLLVLGAYAILNTINPQMLSFNLSINRPLSTPTAPVVAGGVPMTAQQLAQDSAVRNSLPSGVTAYAGPCTQGQTTGCVNLNGLPSSAIGGLASLRNNCNCDVVLTGGTEGGHETHGVGSSRVDVRKSSGVSSYVNNNKIGNPVQTKDGILYTVQLGSTNAQFLDEGDHWHVIFK